MLFKGNWYSLDVPVGWEEGAVEGDRWLGVCLQCAHSSNVGHALLAALLWQKMASQEEADTQVCLSYRSHESSPERHATADALLLVKQ